MAIDNKQPRFSIGAVARRTGLTPLVLRAWERRYGLVNPERTATGRRMYSLADIERLGLLRALTNAGHRIGDVASLPLSELHGLARESGAGKAAPGSEAPSADAEVPGLLEEALAATAALDPIGLETALRRASVSLSPVQMRRDIIQPLLVEIGERWRKGTLRIAHEHMASAVVNAFLAGLNARHHVAAGSPVLAVATPSGDLHELGALLASSHALEVGYDVLYLGANLPAEEIAAGVGSRGACVLYLSLVYPLNDPGIRGELATVRQLLGAVFPVLVGGRGTDSYAETLDDLGMLVVAGADDFDRLLTDLILN